MRRLLFISLILMITACETVDETSNINQDSNTVTGNVADKFNDEPTSYVVNANDGVRQAVTVLRLLNEDMNQFVYDPYIVRHFANQANKLNRLVGSSYQVLKQQKGRLSEDFLGDYCRNQLAEIELTSANLFSAVMQSSPNKNNAKVAEMTLASSWTAKTVSKLLQCDRLN